VTGTQEVPQERDTYFPPDALPDKRLGRHIAGQLVRSGTSPAISPIFKFTIVNLAFSIFSTYGSR
jgi:hypothetical protein